MQAVAVGLGVRDELLDELVALRDRSALDLLEVMIDDGLDDGPRRAAWRRLGARWPLVAHGTELGIADAAGVDAGYVGRVGSALGVLAARWYSEHLSFLRAGDVDLGHFAVPSEHPGAIEVLRANVARVAAAWAGPLLLENPADVLGWGHEAGAAALGARFAAQVAAVDAGVLLDLTNLVLSARNDGFAAGEWLGALEMDRVVEVHLAGGRFDGALWIDSHDHDVDAEALELLGVVARRASNLRAVVIERDERLPSLDHLLGEVARVRASLIAAGRG